ncbi:MAG: cyclopropane fatty-acyl-phospholipid synthase-like methyltransferase [Cocleimonas sp.]|jgi:cyclopropane fatty-acyl-phospholipid synthase-like methyltransferase
MKPFSESCIQNQEEICEVLQKLLTDKQHVLEIGSGTGQHAVYFAKKLPHITWQTSDQKQYHQGINQWLSDAGRDNTVKPICLDVSKDTWPKQDCKKDIDVLFSANAIHIMAWNNVIDYFNYGTKLLKKDGLFLLYGPFNYNQNYTSQSNADFDQWLKMRDSNSGIRGFEALDQLANENHLVLIHDIEMAANNRILCWQKI